MRPRKSSRNTSPKPFSTARWIGNCGYDPVINRFENELHGDKETWPYCLFMRTDSLETGVLSVGAGWFVSHRRFRSLNPKAQACVGLGTIIAEAHFCV